MRTRAVSLCVLFTLGFVACGSDKATTASPEADMATAKKLVLTPADFPSGWTAKPDDQTQSAEDKADSKELSDCVGTSGPEAEKARWNGDEFTMDQFQVSSEANVVADKAVFKKDVAAIKSPKLQTCVKEVFTKVLTKTIGTTPKSVDVTPFEVKKYGDVTVGLRMKVDMGTGAADTVYVDLVLMGKNRAEVTATVFALGQPLDPALENSLLAKLGSRVNAA